MAGKKPIYPLQPKSVDQIGIVVRDIDKVIASWSELFGIGPWTFLNIDTKDSKGRPGKARLAFTRLGSMPLELLQPLEGGSVYSEFLDKCGEGLHHISFVVDNLEGESNNLIAQGARVLSSEPGVYAYLETGPGGVIFELLQKR